MSIFVPVSIEFLEIELTYRLHLRIQGRESYSIYELHTGQCCDLTLLKATEMCISAGDAAASEQFQNIMQLLVQHRASINHDKVVALKLAVASSRND